jgi:hypothetical protein
MGRVGFMQKPAQAQACGPLPPTPQLYPIYEETETALYKWTAERGYGFRINRITWIDS